MVPIGLIMTCKSFSISASKKALAKIIIWRPKPHFFSWKVNVRVIINTSKKNLVKSPTQLRLYLLSTHSPPPPTFFYLNERYDDHKTFYITMALILPQLKDTDNFVLYLTCSLCTILSSLLVSLTHTWLSYVFGVIRKRPIHLTIYRVNIVNCQALSISQSLNLSLSLRDRDRADTIITLPHHPQKTF